MNHTLSQQTVPSPSDRPTGGRFAVGNAGGPGNPFARQTAALRAYLISHVTERDIQDILDILLLNAKGGHLPSIKFLFSYVIGKPKSVVEPDLLDLQEMQMLQQSSQPPEALATLCDQLPLDLQVQLTHSSQADNAATAVQAALDSNPEPAPPSSNGTDGEPHGPAMAEAPPTNGFCERSEVASGTKAPSTNGEFRRPPKRAGFDWLSDLRRAFGARAQT